MAWSQRREPKISVCRIYWQSRYLHC